MTSRAEDSRGLRHGPLSKHTVHVCVDMQRLFADDTAWKTPWMTLVLPNVVALAQAQPEQTMFTRFIRAAHAGDGQGAWARYWRRWSNMTLERLAPEMIGLVPELARFAPPATIIDKRLYSPWIETLLETDLKQRGTDTLIVSGSETDVCVLATVLGAVDRGYRVLVVADALCSSSDDTHDALMMLYHQRYTEQVEVITTQDALSAWR